jgi:hypothetical protein
MSWSVLNMSTILLHRQCELSGPEGVVLRLQSFKMWHCTVWKMAIIIPGGRVAQFVKCTLYPEDGGWRFFRNVGIHLLYHVASYRRRQQPLSSKGLSHASLHISFCRFRICFYRRLSILFTLSFLVLYSTLPCVSVYGQRLCTDWIMMRKKIITKNLKQNHSIGFGWFRKFNSCQFPTCELQSSITQFTLPSLNKDVPSKLLFSNPSTCLSGLFWSTINLWLLSVILILQCRMLDDRE